MSTFLKSAEKLLEIMTDAELEADRVQYDRRMARKRKARLARYARNRQRSLAIKISIPPGGTGVDVWTGFPGADESESWL
jgi:hypothetical protein